MKFLIDSGAHSLVAIIHSKGVMVHLLELLQPVSGMHFNIRYLDTSKYFPSLEAMLSYGIEWGLFSERKGTYLATTHKKNKGVSV